ncbi:MAG: acyl-CoA thioester hydrolase [Alphaproteobacteria bacterium]|jgi:acyl-CoA thioester hydrolase
MYNEQYTVRFYETDALGHVGNTVVVGWFEAARLPLFRLFVPDLCLQNWPLILANYNVDFVLQIYLQNPVQIKTWISRIGNSSFEVYQECWQLDELKAKGKTTLVHFDYAAKKSKAIPDEISTTLQTHMHKPGA